MFIAVFMSSEQTGITYGPVKFPENDWVHNFINFSNINKHLQFRDPADPNIFPVCTLPPNVRESPASPAVPMSKVLK